MKSKKRDNSSCVFYQYQNMFNSNDVVIREDFSNALLRVTGGSIAGSGSSAPYVHASGPCGTPGASASVPLTFLLDQQHPYGDPGYYYLQQYLKPKQNASIH